MGRGSGHSLYVGVGWRPSLAFSAAWASLAAFLAAAFSPCVAYLNKRMSTIHPAVGPATANGMVAQFILSK